MKAPAGLCVDMDSLRVHLVGYGITDCADVASIYDIALPRMLALFAEHSAKATFFFVASEVSGRPDVLQKVSAAGHEIACHSLTHPIPFLPSDKTFFKREVEDAKAVLEQAAGTEVSGFRAPSWAGSVPLAEAVAKAGYRYDASAFPSWVMKLRSRMLEKRAVTSVTAETKRKLPSQKTPYHLSLSGHDLVELPVSVTPLVGFPYYHTPRLMAPALLFAGVELLMKLRPSYVTYTFHAVDFLSTDEDKLDDRIKRHPGMMMMLADKLGVAKRALTQLGNGRAITTLRAIADSVQ